MEKLTVENWNFPFFCLLTIFPIFVRWKFQNVKLESRAFICVMNIVVKIKVVEDVKLYRKFWISRSRDYTGGELWKSWRLKIEIFRFLPFDDFLNFREIKIPNLKSEFRHFRCVMNIAVKIKVVENVKLYRNSWISNSRSYTGGELWKSWRLKIEISRFLPFDDFLDFHEMKKSKLKVRISTKYMYNEYCGQNKSCRERQTI